jgi:hypothetical protein
MGFWDSLLGTEEERAEKREETKVLAKPFKINTTFHPLRLGANKRNSVSLIVKITNVSKDPQLVSMDVMLPKDQMLGFESTCLHKSVEKKVGEVAPGATVEASVPLWANNQTKPGNYRMNLKVYSHYQDYNKVLNYMEKAASVRVV